MMNEVYPFLELLPGYMKVLSYYLILDFVTLLILGLLIVQYVRRKHRSYELSLFFQMCLCNVLMVLCSMVFDIAPVFWTVDEDNVVVHLLTRFLVSWVVDQIFSVTMLTQWLLFVEYTLHHSRDLIRRRYPVVMVPFITAIVLAIIRIPIAFCHNGPLNVMPIYRIFTAISFAIFAFYIIAAYTILYWEKKRVRVPEYIRLTPTTFCIVIGFIADMFLTDYPVLQLFFALGLLFADYYMYRRLNWIDPKTGFFNRKYLSTLISVARKDNLMGATVIRFRVRSESDVMADILKSWKPEHCKTLTMGDGLFLLVSEPIKDSVAERFIYLVSEQAVSKGLTVDADYVTDREEPVHVMLKKYV